MSDYSEAKREYDSMVARERAEAAIAEQDPHLCYKCNHYFDTPNHEYGCVDSPRRIKKSEATILNSHVPDSSGRLTKKIMAEKAATPSDDEQKFLVWLTAIKDAAYERGARDSEMQMNRERAEAAVRILNEHSVGYKAAMDLHHKDRCCGICDTHVMPHRGCILR